MNEDQVRSRASKPALEMALNELNEVSKVLALEKEEYKREEEEKIQVEVKKRLEKLVSRLCLKFNEVTHVKGKFLFVFSSE